MIENDQEFQDLLEVLREYLRSCPLELNENDKAYVIIGHCIVAELNTKLRICQMTKALGRNTRHIAKYLDDRTGRSPERHDWYVDGEGR